MKFQIEYDTKDPVNLNVFKDVFYVFREFDWIYRLLGFKLYSRGNSSNISSKFYELLRVKNS